MSDLKKLPPLEKKEVMMKRVKEKREASVKAKIKMEDFDAIADSFLGTSLKIDTGKIDQQEDKAEKYKLIKAKYKEEGVTTLDMMRFLSELIDGKEPPVRQRRE